MSLLLFTLMPTMSAGQPSTPSPEVEIFTRSAEQGDALAEARFWEQRSTPLIEPLAGEPGWSLVTFLFRGPEEARNVIVVTPLSLIDFSLSVMERVPGTRTWYRTYRLLDSTRFLYRFGIDDNLIPFERDPNVFARMGSWVPDPANPKRFQFDDGSQASILELRSEPEDRWIHPRADIAKGRLEEHAFRSHVLSEERTLHVYLPVGYSRDSTPYPLIIFHDGDSYRSLIPAPTILDNLLAEGKIPPTVAIFVPAAADARSEEYNCDPRWSRVVAREIVPWARERYHAGIDASRTHVAGFSLGGLAAACAAFAHPEVFGGVLSQSGSFFRAPLEEAPEWLARSIAAGGQLPNRWALEIGTYERGAIPSSDPSMLTANRHLRDVLVARGATVRYREYAAGHEHVAWRSTLAPALVWLLNP